MTNTKYKSKSAAINTLKRFFAQYPTLDRLSVEKIFSACGREQKSNEANMAWLSNKLLNLRYYNLVSPDYSYEGRRRLEAITLTIQGKKALGRLGTEDSIDPKTVQSHNIPTTPVLTDALAIVTQLQKNYPEYKIRLIVEPKE